MTNQDKLTTRKNILNGLEHLRKSCNKSHEIFTEGGCFRLALMLDSFFGGDLYYDSSHCIFCKDDWCYDITGEVLKENHTKLETYGANQLSRIFQLQNHQPDSLCLNVNEIRLLTNPEYSEPDEYMELFSKLNRFANPNDN